ncbi:MAG: SsrA-binding protein SmpB [Synergistetes bacterium]|nr:SsrA-binding protein SmpB [Synergistota bacterium]MDW8192877.1 SsrA-binding protein SmpB [Synergistota bacterium]
MKIIAQNKKAFHDYEILETYEAGIVLQGSEIKSIRDGRVNLKDSYAKVKEGELWLYDMHISPYDKASFFNHDPLRPRKLLLHKKEIVRLIGKVNERGLTLIPLKLYINDRGKAKIELALAKGKKLHDKRKAIAEKDLRRELERALKYR